MRGTQRSEEAGGKVRKNTRVKGGEQSYTLKREGGEKRGKKKKKIQHPLSGHTLNIEKTSEKSKPHLTRTQIIILTRLPRNIYTLLRAPLHIFIVRESERFGKKERKERSRV